MAYSSSFDWHALVPYAVGLLLIFILWRLWRSLTAYPARQEFALALNTQVRHSVSAEQLASEIETLYRQVSIRAPLVRSSFPSAADMLADILYDFDVGTAAGGRFGSRQVARYVLADQSGDQAEVETRAKLINALSVLKHRNPFGSLSGNQANILRTLKQALDTANSDLAHASLGQIVEEIASLNGGLVHQERVSRNSFQVSVVSLILTAVFGVASIGLFVVQESATHPS